MKSYALYFLVLKKGEDILKRFNEVVSIKNYDIDNFYYPNLEQVYKAYQKKYNVANPGVSCIIYERDSSSVPSRYRVIPKSEVMKLI